MPEELRIIVTDEAGPASATAPATPRVGAAPASASSASGVSQSIPTPATAMPGSIPISPPIAPPPFTPSDRKNQSIASARRTAQVGVSAATAAASGNVGGVASVAGAALAAITGPVGVAALAITGALGASALALSKFVGVVKKNAADLAGFSPELAEVQAIGSIRRTFAQFRRAQEIGPDLARAENLRQRFDDKVFDLWTQVLKVGLNISQQLEPLIEGGLSTVGAIGNFVENNSKQIEFFIRLALPIMSGGLSPGIDGFLGLASQFFKDQIDDKEINTDDDPFTMSFLRGAPPQPDGMQFNVPLPPIAEAL